MYSRSWLPEIAKGNFVYKDIKSLYKKEKTMATKTLARRNGGHLLTNVFNDFFSPWTDLLAEPTWERALTIPAVNITETDKSYQLSVAAPGLKKEDFNVDVDGNMLTISAEKEENKEEKDSQYTRKEYNYSSFSRTFTLPNEVKQSGIEAEYKDGVLHLMLPKTETAQKATTKVKIK